MDDENPTDEQKEQAMLEVINSLVEAINGLQKFATDTQECMKLLNSRLKELEQPKQPFSL